MRAKDKIVRISVNGGLALPQAGGGAAGAPPSLRSDPMRARRNCRGGTA
jgi:hypothetical protein